MRKCIWCQRTEKETKFDKKAHSIPKNLGGEHICENVCDKCNEYFGKTGKGSPAIETVLKETFNISRLLFLKSNNEVGKNKALNRFSSIYFDIDLDKKKFKIKNAYKFQPYFQKRMCRLLKRGIYKMFLEERERQFGDGLDKKYHFIREFARYDIGDYPLYYFTRKLGVILSIPDWFKHPELFFEKEFPMKYLYSDSAFFEFEFLGHVFGIPVTRSWELFVLNYLKNSTQKKQKIFKSYKEIKRLDDMDLILSVMSQ